MMQSEYKLGTCRWCRERGEVYRDNLLCEECDSDTAYCRVCRCRQHCETSCRHAFQNSWLEWHGSGIDPQDDAMMVPFHRLLSAMSEDFARDLRDAIASKSFYTWLVAPMIGGGGRINLYGMPVRDGRRVASDYGNRLIELGSSERAEQLHDGYCWLASLYKNETMIANRTTIRWINRWLWPLTPAREGTAP